MDGPALYLRLSSLDRLRGGEARSLVIGGRTLTIEGLDLPLATRLDARWDGFLRPDAPGSPRAILRVLRGGAGAWLARGAPGELYRIEALNDGQARVVASYHFAIGAEREPAVWRVGLSDDSDEPGDRLLDNAVRFCVARLALDDGGFALHAAGVLCQGRAHLFAGPSRAGKSTAVRLVAGATSLGDDFGVVLPGPGGWFAPALPFDNSEQVRDRPTAGLHPLAGIWRLRQAATTHAERLPAERAAASLLACVAFPWTMPERAGELLSHVQRFVADDRFRELHFTLDADLRRECCEEGAPDS